MFYKLWNLCVRRIYLSSSFNVLWPKGSKEQLITNQWKNECELAQFRAIFGFYRTLPLKFIVIWIHMKDPRFWQRKLQMTSRASGVKFFPKFASFQVQLQREYVANLTKNCKPKLCNILGLSKIVSKFWKSEKIRNFPGFKRPSRHRMPSF